MRSGHIMFIEKDTKERGETIVSDITFLGALYHCKVKKEGSKRARTVKYSAAINIMDGYRKINAPERIK